jgi:hypothetical protein
MTYSNDLLNLVIKNNNNKILQYIDKILTEFQQLYYIYYNYQNSKIKIDDRIIKIIENVFEILGVNIPLFLRLSDHNNIITINHACYCILSYQSTSIEPIINIILKYRNIYNAELYIYQNEITLKGNMSYSIINNTSFFCISPAEMLFSMYTPVNHKYIIQNEDNEACQELFEYVNNEYTKISLYSAIE